MNINNYDFEIYDEPDNSDTVNGVWISRDPGDYRPREEIWIDKDVWEEMLFAYVAHRLGVRNEE